MQRSDVVVAETSSTVATVIDEFTLRPISNPFTDVLEVSTLSEDTLVCSVYDMLGRRVQAVTLDRRTRASFDLRAMASGMYICSATNGRGLTRTFLAFKQ